MLAKFTTCSSHDVCVFYVSLAGSIVVSTPICSLPYSLMIDDVVSLQSWTTATAVDLVAKGLNRSASWISCTD